MRSYSFTIINDKIDSKENGTKKNVLDFNYFKKAANEKVYYKVTNGEISNIIVEATDHNTATKAVEQFLLRSRSLVAAD